MISKQQTYKKKKKKEMILKMKRKRGTQMGTRRRAWKRRRTVVHRRRSNLELKFKDTTVTEGLINETGTLQTGPLTIAEGTDDDQRVGRKIVLTKLQWRYTLTILQTTDGQKSNDTIRVMVLLDKQCNGANPTIAGASGIVVADTFDAYMQLANSGRFTVLMNRWHNMNCTAAVGDGTTNEYGQNSRFFQWHKEVNIPIEYDTSVTTGAIASIRSNVIQLILWSENGACNMVSKFRVRYTD